MKNTPISRRAVLAGTVATGALGLSGFPARAEVNWKKYAGTTIEANLIKGPRGELLQKYASEFTDLTGIKVESEVIPEQQQRQKAVIELTSGKPSFDVIHLSYHVQKRQFEKAGWLADMTPFMKDPNLTASDLTVDDFSAGGRQFAQNDKGEMHSLPWSVDYFILYWNKELFAKKGVDAAEDHGRDGRRRRKAQRSRQRHLRLYRPRPAQRQHDAVDQFLPQLRRRIPRRQGQHPDRRPRGDRSHQDVSAPADQERPSRRRRFQLDGIDGDADAGPRRDVDRRRRLGAADRGSQRLARGRQDRLCTGAGRTEGPVFRRLWRRHRHSHGQHEKGSRLSLLPMGGIEDHGRAAAAERRRCPVPQLDPQRRDRAQGREEPGVARTR